MNRFLGTWKYAKKRIDYHYSLKGSTTEYIFWMVAQYDISGIVPMPFKSSVDFQEKHAVALLHPNQMGLPRGIFQMALTHGVVIY